MPESCFISGVIWNSNKREDAALLQKVLGTFISLEVKHMSLRVYDIHKKASCLSREKKAVVSSSSRLDTAARAIQRVYSRVVRDETSRGHNDSQSAVSVRSCTTKANAALLDDDACVAARPAGKHSVR
eukprot:5916391-Pleurochrysis_carterae.AAC.1